MSKLSLPWTVYRVKESSEVFGCPYMARVSGRMRTKKTHGRMEEDLSFKKRDDRKRLRGLQGESLSSLYQDQRIEEEQPSGCDHLFCSQSQETLLMEKQKQSLLRSYRWKGGGKEEKIFQYRLLFMNIFINFFKILFQNRKNQRKTDIFVLKMSVCQQSEATFLTRWHFSFFNDYWTTWLAW